MNTGDLIFYTKPPDQASKLELDKFHELVLEGGKVMKQGLYDRIINCAVLGFCVHNDNIVGISSIKRPQKSYVAKVIANANLTRKDNELEYEIGYSFTKPEYRKNGISSNIKKSLLEWMKNYGGTVFSTTAIKSSQNFLLKHNFVNKGTSFDGKNDKNIKYYEIVYSK